MIVLALAGPWLALGFLLVMEQLERWLDDSVWGTSRVPRGPSCRWRERWTPSGPGRGTRRLGGCSSQQVLVSQGSRSRQPVRVRISAPLSVTRMVCSNCADRLPSAVTTVQPSSHISHSWVPRLSMGSMVNVMPGSITVE